MKDQEMPSAAGIEAAIGRIRPYLPVTPVIKSELFSERFGFEVFLKIETTSPIGSFKLRGALNGILGSSQRESMIVSSSTGNHGQAVAWAAREVNRPCTIFLPEQPHPVKRHKIKLLGAKIVEVGHDIDVAKEAAKSFSAEKGALFIDDGEDRLVMEGAGTIGWEIGKQLENIDAVLVPIGGGNLVSGTAVGLKSCQPAAQVIAVAPAAGPAMHDSYHARKPVERAVNTVADCLATRIPPTLSLEAIINYVDEVVKISDDDFFKAAHTLALYGHLLAEPGSAGGIAALVRHSHLFKEAKRVVVLITGANLDRETLSSVLNAEPLINF